MRIKKPRILHTRQDINTVGPRPTLCGVRTGSGHGWVTMEIFITQDFEHLSHDIFDYSYCQECRDKITPMDYLNAVKL